MSEPSTVVSACFVTGPSVSVALLRAGFGCDWQVKTTPAVGQRQSFYSIPEDSSPYTATPSCVCMDEYREGGTGRAVL